MKRKIIRLAEKTLVVSLPSSWLADQGLDKGDQLDCLEQGDRLVFVPEAPSSSHSSASLDIGGLSERVLRWQISSLHKQGYDEIEITSYTPEQYKVIEDLVTNLFVGFIIKEQSKLRILIGQVAVMDAAEFDSTLRRAFRLLLSSAKETLEAFRNRDAELLHNQISAEKNNNKLTNFCERLLNKSLHRKQKGHFWYVIAWNLEKVADNFKYLATYYAGSIPVLDKDVLDLFEDVITYVNSYYGLFYDFSFRKLVEVSDLKTDLETKLLARIDQVRKDEVVLLHYLHIILLQVADFSASTIAINYDG
ncbi:MAG: hypothetical protein ACLFTH_02810 [Candidatus Woesearchaeota archaeon]